MPVGVISHLPNPSFAAVRGLAEAAERAGADWLGLPDAFWWRDTYLLLAEAAHATHEIGLGPMVTNAYLRHPFQTLAALASLQDLAGPKRVFVGIGAGGSELSGAASTSRRDAPDRVRSLVALLRRVADGEPLDPESGRRLEVPLHTLRVLVAGRGDRMLATAGACADSALLWAIPQSDLARSAKLIGNKGVDLVWAPLVDHGGQSLERVRTIAAYSVLNSHPTLHVRWGLERPALGEILRKLVGGGGAAAESLVPRAALDDLVIADATPAVVAKLAASIGATSIAIPAFSIEEVEPRVAWARSVLAASA